MSLAVFIWSQLRHRSYRAAALAAGIVVASVSFVLLTSSARTSSLHVRGSVRANYRSAYDILVRPPGAAGPLERHEGLVRDNFLSGIFGGISVKQYHQIRTLPGVEVAAPIANLGYVLLSATATVPLARFLTADAAQLFRVRFSYSAQQGLSRYPAGDEYVYYAPRGRFVRSPTFGQLVGRSAAPLPVCYGFGATQPLPMGPFDRAATSVLNCYSGTSRARSGLPGPVATGFNAYFPVMLSAIDPVEEARLLNLDKTVVSGRYLRADDAPKVRISPARGSSRRSGLRFIPVIASSRTFVQESLQASIERLRVPAGLDVPRMLAAGGCAISFEPCPAADLYHPPRGAPFGSAYEFLTRLPGTLVGQQITPVSSLYGELLRGTFQAGRVDFSSYWSVSPVRYLERGKDRVEPIETHNDPATTWQNQLAYGGYYQAPADNQDTQFRKLHEHTGSNLFSTAGILRTPRLRVVGTYDPTMLPGFSPLSKVPLETYQPPQLQPGNAATSKLLGGRPLLPDQNVGGYIAQPPLLLTTLTSIGSLFDRQAFSNISAAQIAAPISVIRVRVAGVHGPDSLSQTRIRTVAELIHNRTGLEVDITAGSSPHPLLVTLPQGRFGRPALLLREGWSKKGVSLAFLRALDRKDLALFALILVVCVFFLSNNAFAATRARRSEIGTLRTLGWTRGEIMRAIVGELALIGILAGLVGTTIAAIIVSMLSLSFPLVDVLYVLPLSLALAVLAGLIPAARASRLTPLAAIRPPLACVRRARHARGLISMAVVNLLRLPGRSLAAGAGLALGVAALTFLIGVERAFQGTLVGTLLGNAISLQVRNADFAAILLAVALAALSVADVLYLNLRERAAELVTLRTVGWSDREVRTLVGLEALILSAGAAILGGAAGGLSSGLLLDVPQGPLAVAATIAAAGGTVATMAASLIPLVQLERLTVPTVLAAE